jgi:hypothetical protein
MIKPFLVLLRATSQSHSAIANRLWHNDALIRPRTRDHIFTFVSKARLKGAARFYVRWLGLQDGRKPARFPSHFFGNAVDRHCRIDDDHIGKTNERSDRRSIPDEIEIELGEQRDIGRVRGCGKQQRVAVGCSVDDRLGGDIRAGAAFDDKLLTKALRKPRTC